MMYRRIQYELRASCETSFPSKSARGVLQRFNLDYFQMYSMTSEGQEIIYMLGSETAPSGVSAFRSSILFSAVNRHFVFCSETIQETNNTTQ